MSPATRERRHLVDRLRHEGALTDPRWIEAFRHVPRHVFLPRFFVPHGTRWKAVARGDDGWLAATYSDDVLVTQLDDNPAKWEAARRDGPTPGIPTCSSSMPAIMAVMLEELRVAAGDRVLEIGTGTGYNTALLCRGLGDANVASVDVDPSLVLTAREALASLGYSPECEASDGERGFAAGAPYDRVLCTCSVSRIPPDWLAQTRPGGLVLTTLNRPIGAGLVRLVAGAGAVGQGRVLPRDGRFMPLRAHRRAGVAAVLARRAVKPSDPVARRPTSLPLATVLDPGSPFEFFAGLALPGVSALGDPDDGDGCYLAHPDGSWARHRTVGEDTYVVEQGGPRPLWDTAEEAYEQWHDLDRPAREDFGVTVTPDGQEFWLHEPASVHRWPLGP